MRGSCPTCRVCHSLGVQVAIPNDCKAALGEQSCRRCLTIGFRRRHRGVHSAATLLAADKAVARRQNAMTRDNLQITRFARGGPGAWQAGNPHELT